MKSARWISIALTSIALSMTLIATHSAELHAEGKSAVAPTQAPANVVAGGHAVMVGTTSGVQPAGVPPSLPSTFATAIMNVPTASSPEPSDAGGGSSASPSPSPNQPALVIQLAEQDLAKRIGVPPSQIDLLSVNKTSWSDGSLGNPQPGLSYSQVVTPGYQITLQANDQAYIYHSDTGRQVVYCGTP